MLSGIAECSTFRIADLIKGFFGFNLKECVTAEVINAMEAQAGENCVANSPEPNEFVATLEMPDAFTYGMDWQAPAPYLPPIFVDQAPLQDNEFKDYFFGTPVAVPLECQRRANFKITSARTDFFVSIDLLLSRELRPGVMD